MPFHLPENLHPDCAPIAWLLGTWHGNGHGDYPTIEAFQYEQELVFQQDGRPFFAYSAHSWVIDPETKERIRPAAMETGFIRSKLVEPGKATLEMTLAHNLGFAEVWFGEAAGLIDSIEPAGLIVERMAAEAAARLRTYGGASLS